MGRIVSDRTKRTRAQLGGVCGQTVRFGLVDVFASLMQMSPEHFLEASGGDFGAEGVAEILRECHGVILSERDKDIETN